METISQVTRDKPWMEGKMPYLLGILVLAAFPLFLDTYGQGLAKNDRKGLFPGLFAHFFGILDPPPITILRSDDGRSDHRARQGTPSGLIDTRNQRISCIACQAFMKKWIAS